MEDISDTLKIIGEFPTELQPTAIVQLIRRYIDPSWPHYKTQEIFNFLNVYFDSLIEDVELAFPENPIGLVLTEFLRGLNAANWSLQELDRLNISGKRIIKILKVILKSQHHLFMSTFDSDQFNITELVHLTQDLAWQT